MANLAKRITVDLERCGGRPCILGMRVRVTDVLDLLAVVAVGLTPEQVISELPYAEFDDVRACIRFASQRLDHTVVTDESSGLTPNCHLVLHFG